MAPDGGRLWKSVWILFCVLKAIYEQKNVNLFYFRRYCDKIVRKVCKLCTQGHSNPRRYIKWNIKNCYIYTHFPQIHKNEGKKYVEGHTYSQRERGRNQMAYLHSRLLCGLCALRSLWLWHQLKKTASLRVMPHLEAASIQWLIDSRV